MAARFSRLAAYGWIQVDHPETTASFVNWLVMSKPLNEAMLLGDRARTDTASLHRLCREAVRIFLAAYQAQEATSNASQ